MTEQQKDYLQWELIWAKILNFSAFQGSCLVLSSLLHSAKISQIKSLLATLPSGRDDDDNNEYGGDSDNVDDSYAGGLDR